MNGNELNINARELTDEELEAVNAGLLGLLLSLLGGAASGVIASWLKNLFK
jgi:hypothetical protein